MLRARSPFLLAAAFALLAIAPQAASAGTDESTAFQVTPGHTGFASGGSLERPPLQTRWSRTVGTYTSYPLIAAGRVFLIAYDPEHAGGTLLALDPADGSTIWSRSVPNYGEIAYDSGHVFVAEESGTVVGVSAATGATQWTHTLPEPFSLKNPVAAGGVVYVDSSWSGGSVYALDADDGSLRWRANGSYGGSPAVDGTFVYDSDDYEGATAAFSRVDGRRAWSGTAECFVGSGQAVADGARVIAPFNYGCGAVVDAVNGHQLDTFSSSTAPATAGDVAVSLNGTVLQARSLSTGVLLWEFAGDSHIFSPPTIVNETVYAGSSSGTLFAVDLRTGLQLWSGLIGGASTPGRNGMAAGGGLLVAPAGGTVVALESVSAPRPGLDLAITSGPDGPTNASTATFAFGSTAATPKMCRLDHAAWSACSGTATYLGLSEGPHMFEVQTRSAVDGSTIALAARGWSIDSHPPAASITTGPAGVTSSTWASFTLGTNDAAALVQCRLDGAAWDTCSSTSPSYYIPADGPHRLDVRAIDGIGNTQSPPASWTWRIDTKAPLASIDSGPQGATTDTSATFTFSADEPSTFRCQVDQAPYAPCNSPYQMSGISTGTHAFRVLATDQAGNEQSNPTSRTWNIGVDAVPPDTTIYSAPPSVNAGPTARFYFTASENAVFECRLDGASWQSCWSPRDVITSGDGSHTFEVRAIDEGGNVDPTPASWTWVVDTTPPDTTIVGGSIAGSTAMFTFLANESASFVCQLDTGPWMVCASGVTYPGLTAGQHTFAARASDVAGNVEPEAATRVFSVAVGSQPQDGSPGSSAAPAVLPQTSGPTLARLLADTTVAKLKQTSRSKLRRGPMIRVYATEPGAVSVKTTMRKGASRIVFARVRVVFTGAGARSVRLKTTGAGRRALKRRGKLKVAVKVTVAPAGSKAASASASARI
jgi:outer membrane protein assembly factor BamB